MALFETPLDTRSGVPYYRQIIDRVMLGLADGKLGTGDKLPTVRQLAVDLKVNPNTVARAYRELEVAGVLMKRRGAGTYVAEVGSPLAYAERLKILIERVDGLLAEARQLDVPLDDVLRLVHERDDDLQAAAREDDSDAT